MEDINRELTIKELEKFMNSKADIDNAIINMRKMNGRKYYIRKMSQRHLYHVNKYM